MDRFEVLKKKEVEVQNWFKRRGLLFAGEEISIRIIPAPPDRRLITDEEWDDILRENVRGGAHEILEILKSRSNQPTNVARLGATYGVIDAANARLRKARLPFRIKSFPHGSGFWIDKSLQVVRVVPASVQS